MTDIQADNGSEVLLCHLLTSWTGDRIIQSLSGQLPTANGAREQEALYALQVGKYSRCKIYLQLVEDSAYIKAIALLSNLSKAVEECLPTLPTLFKESVYAINEAHNQAVLASGDSSRSKERQQAALASLEKLSIDVFARGLEDEDEQ
ncbi:MAG: hypothetical protein WBA76_21025 [Phormidesmis sp.]